MTRTPLSSSKGQGHQAALLTAALTRQQAAAVTVGTYCYVAVCRRGRLGGTRRFGPHRGRRGAGHIVAAARLQLVRQTAKRETTSMLYVYVQELQFHDLFLGLRAKNLSAAILI